MAEAAGGPASPEPASGAVAGTAPGAPERALAVGAARALALLAVPVLTVAWLLEGAAGVAGAAVGLTFVAVLFVGSSLGLAWAAARGGGSVALGVLLGGALGRLLLYAAALVALSNVEGLHRASLAIATAVAVAVTLAYELRLLARDPRLFRVETGTTRSSHP